MGTQHLVERRHRRQCVGDQLVVEPLVTTGRPCKVPGVDQEIVDDDAAHELLEGEPSEGAVGDHCRKRVVGDLRAQPKRSAVEPLDPGGVTIVFERIADEAANLDEHVGRVVDELPADHPAHGVARSKAASPSGSRRRRNPAAAVSYRSSVDAIARTIGARGGRGGGCSELTVEVRVAPPSALAGGYAKGPR